jgi:hypothetical protein
MLGNISSAITFPYGRTYCMLNEPIENLVSYIPVVFVRALKTSASTGIYSGAEIRVASSKKLQLLICISNDGSLTHYGAESIK